MKSTELFVEQTLTGFLVLTAAVAPFIPMEMVITGGEAESGIDVSSAAGAIGAAYLLGVVFDRFADTLLERLNRWNRLLFAIELITDKKAISPEDPFPEDRLQIEVIRQGAQAWEWMDYLRSRIRIARAMTAFVPALTLSLTLGLGFRDDRTTIDVVLAIVVVAYLTAFLASRILEKSSQRMPKTYHLRSSAEIEHAQAMMRTAKEPLFWLALVLASLGIGLITLNPRGALAALIATGAVLTGISGWTWWRTTITFMQFLRDFEKWGREEKSREPKG